MEILTDFDALNGSAGVPGIPKRVLSSCVIPGSLGFPDYIPGPSIIDANGKLLCFVFDMELPSKFQRTFKVKKAMLDDLPGQKREVILRWAVLRHVGAKRRL
jgi:hypothetical protein